MKKLLGFILCALISTPVLGFSLLNTSNTVQAVNSTTDSIFDSNGFKEAYVSVDCQWTINTLTAKGFVDGDVTVAADTIDETAHGFFTGQKIDLTTSGALPTGLSAQAYYVIKVDADTYKFATSVANANAGTAVDITAAAGGGTHTSTPTALTGAKIHIAHSNDGTNFYKTGHGFIIPDGSSGAMIQNISFGGRYLRLETEIDSGDVDITCDLFAKPNQAVSFPNGVLYTISHDAAATNLTAGSWIEIDSASDYECSGFQVSSMESDSSIQIGAGASGEEYSLGHISASSGNAFIKTYVVPKSSRLVLKSLDATLSTSWVNIDCLK